MIRNTVINSRSYRSFDESKRIGESELRELIETARFCPSGVNRQPLKYRLVYEPAEAEELLALTKWAGLLKDTTLPPEGKHPTAFIVICHDTSVSENPASSAIDVGIAAQTIMLQACELGFGGCMIGAFNPDEVSKTLLISKKYKPVLLLALGFPAENVFICELPESGDTAYFRDKAGLHFVPKRALDDIIIE